jgi:rhamnose utilization protein RhaD (predicted bifunctional aldolase and dehydrogenase)
MDGRSFFLIGFVLRGILARFEVCQHRGKKLIERKTITELSHEFGTVEYVRGGGGNTSVKDSETLCVKPSGTTLCGLKEESFVALNRAKLSELLDVDTPEDSSEREELVKNAMFAARLEGSEGRPSVEAPLHNSLSSKYVVHTHPALVNGMTCAEGGAEVCARLFPDALWLDYVDPGYTLCMFVRSAILKFKAEKGVEPGMIFLKNHGVFVSADEPQEIRAIYANIMLKLREEYDRAGTSMEVHVAECPATEQVDAVSAQIKDSFAGIADIFASASGKFAPYQGPITPDHLVYSYSYPLIGEPTAEAVKGFVAENGYWPRIIAWDGMVFGVGENERKASLALEMSQDGALVTQLAGAFGGICYLSDSARDFIENWEVEVYRKNQI